MNEPLGTAVLETLTEAYAEYSRRLGFHPDEPVTVVLQMSTAFQQDARTPEWAEGVNDGVIRVPVLGLDRPSPRLVQVLRHELAHSFIAARTGGNCPTWLQEGVSQWLEGGDPARDDAVVAKAAREGRLLPLLTLEAPVPVPAHRRSFPLAYPESLSAVAHVLRKRGEAGVVRLLGGALRPSALRGGAAGGPGPQLSRVPEELGAAPHRRRQRIALGRDRSRYQSTVRSSPVRKSTVGR